MADVGLEKATGTTAEKADDPSEYRCGIGSWRPDFLQRVAGPKSFSLFFCILGFLQGAYFTYFIGILSTIEKRYSYESKISGIILIADNISPIFISSIVGFFSRRGNRSHIVAWGMLFVVLANYFAAVPYFIYGSSPQRSISRGNSKNSIQYCTGDSSGDDECLMGTSSTQTIVAIIFFFIGSFFKGFGSTAYYTVGMPYIDDNIKKKNSPIYYALYSSVRLFGPAMGFLLSSLCLRYYEDIGYTPEYGPKDPRWVGAWWLGFVILGSLTFIFTLPLFFFPPKLTTQTIEKSDVPELPKLKDLPEGFRRMFKNPVMMLHSFAFVFNLNGILGYFLVNPRYMEAQFRQSASDASLYSGPISILGLQIGILAGGLVIQIFQPRVRWVVLYDAFTDFMNIILFLTCMFLFCPSLNIAGHVENRIDLTNSCNMDCGCTQEVFTPLCDINSGLTYFSPCHAGCLNDSFSESNKTFSDCSCFFNSLDTSGAGYNIGEGIKGFCDNNCQYIIIYIAILAVGKCIVSSSKVGSILTTLRCVDPHDKAFAMGTLEAILCVLTFIPYPLVYGALTDASCLVWEEKCGVLGNCWIYDVDRLRYYIHGLTLVFVTLGTLCHVGVFLLSHRIRDFYKDDHVEMDVKKEVPSPQPIP